MDVHQALAEFVEKFCTQVDESKRQIQFDSDWPSPCILEEHAEDGQLVTWKPVLQDAGQSFDNLESALELTIHPDIKAFYTLFWSDPLSAKAEQGNCELLQAWNQEDFHRLQENLIGHVLMKRRLKQAVTFFIGLTDEEDFILSVDNDTGQVCLEQVGCEPTRVLAPSISAFLQGLDPKQ
ncbi:SecY-interacting protein [Alteromonas sediminis]|uniref:Protein Syd n=1 Tax=Alteromonas sediminis TaxID=2259342 RepID=A0A3N5ZAW3_9ALTE|nr:SecY-interacting protein [Alteromonas sediminis]RPJ68324.1 SecY-interacting protein [Alteromonas sediminis]